jgi:hypothetical protein
MSLFPIFMPDKKIVATTTYTSTALINSTATVYTFSDQGIGTAFTGRKICVGIYAEAQAHQVTALTVGGIAGTKILGKVSDGGESVGNLWEVDAVNSGTTADIIVTHGTAMNRCGIVVWSLANAASSVHDTGSDGAATSSALTADIDVPANGTAVALVSTQVDSGDASWSGLDKDVETTVSSGMVSGASKDFSAAQSDLTVTGTTVGSQRSTFVTASWGPTAIVPAYITLEASDWQGDTGSATLGSGTVNITAADKNIRTDDALIPAGVDFDFEVEWGDSGIVAQLMGVSDNGTGTGAGKPSTNNPNFTAQATGDADQGGPGWKVGNGVTDSGDTYSGDHNPGSDWSGNKGGSVSGSAWMANNVIGISRRGAVFYGLINGVKDYTYANAAATTSKAVKFYLGGATGGGWAAGATNVRYRRGGGLPDLS